MFSWGEWDFGSLEATVFLFLPPLAAFDTMKEHTTITERSILMTVPDKQDFSWLYATGAVIKVLGGKYEQKSLHFVCS